jgi:hypothetical protein
MAKKLITSYTFTPGVSGAGTITIAGTYALEQFLLITNVTNNIVIYEFDINTLGGTVSAGGGNTTLTLTYDTSGMSSGDRLQLFIDDGQNPTVLVNNSTSSPVPVGPAAQLNVTGSGAALNAELFSVACDAYRSVCVQINGTFVGTIQFQVSNDNSNWSTLAGKLSNDAGGNLVTSTTTPSIYIASLAGYQYLRARFSAYTSGTATAIAYLSRETVALVQPQGGSVTITSGNVGVSNITTSTSSSGTVLYTLNSAATTNAASIKASAANLYGISVMNASATTKYVRLFNLATAPTVGTSIPIMVVAVPATSSKEIEYVPALRFATGLAVAITGGAAVTDATAVAAGDVQLLVSYA